MNLASSMLLVTHLLRRPFTSGVLSQSGPPPGWVLTPAGMDRFDILASRSNGAAPVLTSPDDTNLQIGAAGWQITALDQSRFRIFSSLSNSAAPVVSTTGGSLISIGA